MASEGDLTKINGDIWYAGDVTAVLNSIGANFVDNSQLLFNADYIGFNAKLYNTGVPNLDNVLYSTFQTNTADNNYQFIYDASNDLYVMTDLTGVLNYVIVEASSFSDAWTQGTNDVQVIQINSGAWLVYATTGTSEVQKAKVHKSLWWGDGSGGGGLITKTETPMIDMFTSVTAVKVSDAGDVGKQAHMIDSRASGIGGGGTYDGTFADTSTNTNANSWSYLTVHADSQTTTATWEIPSATILNQAQYIGGIGNDVSDETEIDTSGDDKTNPATVQLAIQSGGTSSNASHGVGIILCKGDITWVDNVVGTEVTTIVDYVGDNSIPLFTSADTLSTEGLGNGTLIFKDTASVSVTNAIASINSTIDATSSVQISISADGGSNYTNVNNGEVARLTAGTALWRRIVITRATLDKLDNVTEQAVKYNFY